MHVKKWFHSINVIHTSFFHTERTGLPGIGEKEVSHKYYILQLKWLWNTIMIMVIYLSFSYELHTFHPYVFIIRKKGKPITLSSLEISFPSIFHWCDIKISQQHQYCVLCTTQFFITLHPKSLFFPTENMDRNWETDFLGGLRKWFPIVHYSVRIYNTLKWCCWCIGVMYVGHDV